MQNDIRISIVIPVYNVEQYIADCLNSVIDQTMTDGIECIIVDDCGQDGSMRIVEEMVEDYSGAIRFTILHHAHNMGLSEARNTGMRAAQGKYIYFLDSDDTITADCIEYLYTGAQSKEYDFVVGNYDVVCTSDLSILKKNYPEGEYYDKDIAVSFAKEKWNMTAWNKLYNTEFLRREKLIFKKGLIHEDELWSLEVAATAKSMICLPQVTYHYRQRESSIMYQVSSLEVQHKAFLEIHHAFVDFLETRGLLGKAGCFQLYLRALNTVLFRACQLGDWKLIETMRICRDYKHLTLRSYLSMPGMNLRLFIRNLYTILPQPFELYHYRLMGKIVKLLKSV